jgi:hypothetical protein
VIEVRRGFSIVTSWGVLVTKPGAADGFRTPSVFVTFCAISLLLLQLPLRFGDVAAILGVGWLKLFDL